MLDRAAIHKLIWDHWLNDVDDYALATWGSEDRLSDRFGDAYSELEEHVADEGPHDTTGSVYASVKRFFDAWRHSQFVEAMYEQGSEPQKDP